MRTIFQKAEGRKVRGAVAYAGARGNDLLPVKAGDLIVVNGSRNAIASGATSVRLLRNWYEQGVLLYAHVSGSTAFTAVRAGKRLTYEATAADVLRRPSPLRTDDAL